MPPISTTGALNSIVPFTRLPVATPPSVPNPISSGLGATAKAGSALGLILGVVSAIGALGGESFRDRQLAQIGLRYNEKTGRADLPYSPYFGGETPTIELRANPFTFTGGQSSGVGYRIKIFGYYQGNITPRTTYRQARGSDYMDGFQVGKIVSVEIKRIQNGNSVSLSAEAKHNNGLSIANTGIYGNSDPTLQFFLERIEIERGDGQPDNGGNRVFEPISTPTNPTTKGLPDPSQRDREKGLGNPPPPFDFSKLNNNLGSINNRLNSLLNKVNGLSSAVGIRSNQTTQNYNANGTVNTNRITTPTAIPLTTPNRTPTPTQPTPTPKPTNNPDNNPDRRLSTPPLPFGNNSDLPQNIAVIGAMLGTIQANTSPEAQRVNSKNGSCDALQSPSCREGLKNDIVNPLSNQIGNAASTIDLMKNVVDNTSGKVDGVRTFLEKVARSAKLDKVYNFLTFITVIHNAQMLSSSLSTTLMDALSLGLATFNIKDENESPIDIQSIVNKSVENTVKSIVGDANYNTISERWKKAMTVYRAATNMLYQVRSLWDSARSLNEMTGANVGQLMNALRKDGVVSENAYPAKSESPMMVNSFMTRLQNLDEAASAIQGITSETSSMVETVAQLNKDRTDFEKLVKESPKKAGVENDAAKAQATAEKTASVSPVINNADLTKPESN